MKKSKKPLLSHQFLDELAKEISQIYGNPETEAETQQGQVSKTNSEKPLKK